MTEDIKKKNVYALVGKNNRVLLVNSKLPIYWLKKVAKEDAKIYGGKVITISGAELTKLLNQNP